MKLKDQRFGEFKNNLGGGGSFFVNLLICASTELELGLHDRNRHARTKDNHYTPHAIGSLALLVAGLESWLNETVTYFSNFDPSLKELVNYSIEKKYKELPKKIFEPAVHDDLALSPDFQTVIDLRHEMVHWIPRSFNNEEGNVPPRFVELHRKQLLIIAQNKSRPEIDFSFEQKLASYKLAYWAGETVEAAVENFLQALGAHGNFLRTTASNFSVFRNVYPPSDLANYDRENNIET